MGSRPLLGLIEEIKKISTTIERIKIKTKLMTTPPTLIRLFSSAVFREMARTGKSKTVAEIVRETGLESKIKLSESVKKVFDVAFQILKKRGQRHEYIYKNAITRKILLGKHSLRTASMLSEFRIGTSKADLVILNGTAAVYEIKSERDSLDRLSGQLRDYRRVFAKINVITDESHLKPILDRTPPETGVLTLDDRGCICIIREGKKTFDDIDPESVLDAITVREAQAILQCAGRDVPDVPNTLIRAHLRDLFVDLEPEWLCQAMANVLRESRSQARLADYVNAVPDALKAMAVSISLPKKNRLRLLSVLSRDVQF